MDDELSLVRQLSEDGNTTELLFLAVARGRLSSISTILSNAVADDKRTLLSSIDQRGATPLHVACESGHVDVIRSLLAAGAPCGSLWEKQTPFQLAQKQHPRAAEPFQTALLQAVCAGDKERCVELIVGGVGPNSHHVLCWAADLGHHDVVKSLLLHGANVNLARSSDRKTPLHLVSENLFFFFCCFLFSIQCYSRSFFFFFFSQFPVCMCLPLLRNVIFHFYFIMYNAGAVWKASRHCADTSGCRGV